MKNPVFKFDPNPIERAYKAIGYDQAGRPKCFGFGEVAARALRNCEEVAKQWPEVCKYVVTGEDGTNEEFSR